MNEAPPRQQQVRFAMDYEDVPTARMMNGVHHRVEEGRRMTTAPPPEPPSAKSVLCVGAASGMMILFSLISVAHLTVRYNDSNTTTVPNFPDHLQQHLRTGGGSGDEDINTTNLLAPLVTADDAKTNISVENPSILPVEIASNTVNAVSVEQDEPEESLKLDNDKLQHELTGDCFDMFLFTMSYEPEFCYSHHTEEYPVCMKPEMNYSTHLVIHGLWPECSDGGYPQFCKTGPEATLDTQVIADLSPQFSRLWPDAKNADMHDPTKSLDFYQHEWAKHGTCTNLTQHQYFQAAFDSFAEPVPPNLIETHYGKEISKEVLIGALEKLGPNEKSGSHSSVMLICDKSKSKEFLKEVRICVGKGAQDLPTHQIPCPDTVVDFTQSEMCQSDSILLSKFREDTAVVDLGKANSIVAVDDPTLPLTEQGVPASNASRVPVVLADKAQEDQKTHVKDHKSSYLAPKGWKQYNQKARSHDKIKSAKIKTLPKYMEPIVNSYYDKARAHDDASESADDVSSSDEDLDDNKMDQDSKAGSGRSDLMGDSHKFRGQFSFSDTDDLKPLHKSDPLEYAWPSPPHDVVKKSGDAMM